MDTEARLNALLELVEACGISIRRLPAGAASDDHPAGSLVRLKDAEVLFLQTNASVPDQISLLAAILRGRKELQDRFLAPEIRQLIEHADA